jgi:hypothetical protein
MILLAALSAEAQTLADVARRERARQAQVESVRTITTDQARSGVAVTTAAGTSSVQTAVRPAASSPAPVDPVVQWQEETQRVRVRIRELQDQENLLQVQLNESTNQFFAPVTDQAARSAAQARIADTQRILDEVRRELVERQTRLQQLEAQGPPQARPPAQ